MKLAVITDLHANREAVSAVLAHAQAHGAEAHVFLGDYVGYGADPGWVLDRVREHVARGAIAVLGNHDEAVVVGPSPTMVAEAKTSATWTRTQLSAEQLAFLKALPLTATASDCLFVHANAFAPGAWGYIEGRSEAARSLLATPHRFTFCGHMHEPRLYHLAANGKGGEFVPLAGEPIVLSAQRRWLAIPGATGQPRDGNPAACYASFDTKSATLTFHRVPYDHEAAGAKIRAAGLPPRFADRLRVGV